MGQAWINIKTEGKLKLREQRRPEWLFDSHGRRAVVGKVERYRFRASLCMLCCFSFPHLFFAFLFFCNIVDGDKRECWGIHEQSRTKSDPTWQIRSSANSLRSTSIVCTTRWYASGRRRINIRFRRDFSRIFFFSLYFSLILLAVNLDYYYNFAVSRSYDTV